MTRNEMLKFLRKEVINHTCVDWCSADEEEGYDLEEAIEYILIGIEEHMIPKPQHEKYPELHTRGEVYINNKSVQWETEDED